MVTRVRSTSKVLQWTVGSTSRTDVLIHGFLMVAAEAKVTGSGSGNSSHSKAMLTLWMTESKRAVRDWVVDSGVLEHMATHLADFNITVHLADNLIVEAVGVGLANVPIVNGMGQLTQGTLLDRGVETRADTWTLYQGIPRIGEGAYAVGYGRGSRDGLTEFEVKTYSVHGTDHSPRVVWSAKTVVYADDGERVHDCTAADDPKEYARARVETRTQHIDDEYRHSQLFDNECYRYAHKVRDVGVLNRLIAREFVREYKSGEGKNECETVNKGLPFVLQSCQLAGQVASKHGHDEVAD
ncbi:hypothetical protein BDV93DRAFT_514997 [Ceratobasidium sp. AG-I]|nr:hypothetical protein BDV93DRAFT_514997 [Ceratobasidium sp. AG-I]